MVKYSETALDETFGALDPARRAILSRLARGPASMGDLARPAGISWPAVTKHVKVLERAKLARREKDGRVHRMHLDAKPMRQARAWIDEYRRFWAAHFDALDRFLAETADEASAEGE